MNDKYHSIISKAVKSFWLTRDKQGNVLAGKQLDGFLDLLRKVAMDAGVPQECIYLKNNHIPGFYRATKKVAVLFFDFCIFTNKKAR